MTENKRFKIVDEQFISYYGGTGHKISNEECGFWLWHSKTESQKVCDRLNNMLDENEQLKQFKTKTFEILKHNIQEASEWKKLDMSNSEKRRLQFLESILIGIERELEKMTEKRSICIDCRHQRGTWINDREIDTWCAIKQNIDCDEMFECDDFME